MRPKVVKFIVKSLVEMPGQSDSLDSPIILAFQTKIGYVLALCERTLSMRGAFHRRNARWSASGFSESISVFGGVFEHGKRVDHYVDRGCHLDRRPLWLGLGDWCSFQSRIDDDRHRVRRLFIAPRPHELGCFPGNTIGPSAFQRFEQNEFHARNFYAVRSG